MGKRGKLRVGGDANERRGLSVLGLFRDNAPPDKSATVQRHSVNRNEMPKGAR